MSIIKLLVRGNDGKDTFHEHNGEIHKGFGIIEILSAGIMAPFVVHIPTGKIIAKLTGAENVEETKKRIDSVSYIINSSMAYEEIEQLISSAI